MNSIKSDIEFLSDYLKKYPKFRFIHLEDEPIINGVGFAALHLKGTYIFEMDGHILVCNIGVIFGAQECTYI